MEQILTENADADKENHTINTATLKPIIKINDDANNLNPKRRGPKEAFRPDFKTVRQSFTTIFRNNTTSTMLPRFKSTCDEAKLLVGGKNEEGKTGTSMPSNSTAMPTRTMKPLQSSSITTEKTLNRKSYAPKTIVSLSSVHQSTKRRSLTLNVNPLKMVMVISRTQKRQSNQSNLQLQNNGSAIETAGPSEASHKKFKKPAEKFKCKLCDKTFRLKTTLTEHQKSHTDANSNCSYCQRAFKKPIALSKHLRENCEKISAFEKKKLLAQDQKLAESIQTKQGSSIFQMKNAGSLSSANHHFKTPIRGIYQTPRKLIKCIHCGDRFMDAVSFATHSVLHSN